MLRQDNGIYEFGPFRLDPAEKTLSKDGESVALTPKAFDTLLILIEKSGRLVEKDELMKQLWPDSFVEENSLSQNIYLLRKALGEAAQGPRYIETVPKRGYRFIAGVKECSARGDNAVENLAMSEADVRQDVSAPEPIDAEPPRRGVSAAHRRPSRSFRPLLI